jgi:hypothetical protein
MICNCCEIERPETDFRTISNGFFDFTCKVCRRWQAVLKEQYKGETDIDVLARAVVREQYKNKQDGLNGWKRNEVGRAVCGVNSPTPQGTNSI